MPRYLVIVFNRAFELRFKILLTPISELWIEKMQKRHQWPLDDPKRFYGFNDLATERNKAKHDLKHCIDIINDHEKIIEREFTNIDDQDLLNYLHNIFERYHGLLDEQNTDWWRAAPEPVKQALANLNIAVHRAESVSRDNSPRLVCTWFGMPKGEQFSKDIIESCGRTNYEFGGVYVNYVEIGKTLEKLSIDNDRWIGDDAFKPFLHYSADFSVRFYDKTADLDLVTKYYKQHQDFFRSRGINSVRDYRSMPYRFKIADLESDLSREEILSRLRENQLITDIYLR
jgi:hypothetical protein